MSLSERPTHLAEDLLAHAIQEFASCLPATGSGNLVFSGGEPLLVYPLLIRLMRLGASLGLGSEVITNAGLIGAHGPYREMLAPDLLNAGLSGRNLNHIADELIKAGLDRLNVSVDVFHNSLEHVTADRVPIDVVVDTLEAFIQRGFGTLQQQLMVAAILPQGSKEDPFIRHLKTQLGATHVNEHWWEVGSVRIYYYPQPMQRQGRASLLEGFDAYPRDQLRLLHCPVTLPHLDEERGRNHLEMPSNGPPPDWLLEELDAGNISYQGWAHNVAVRFDGQVSTCGSHIFPMGNLNSETLSTCLENLNSLRFKEGLECYGAAWCVLQHIPHTNGRASRGNLGQVGEAVLAKFPGWASKITCKHSLCWLVAHDSTVQHLMVSHFFNHIPPTLRDVIQVLE